MAPTLFAQDKTPVVAENKDALEITAKEYEYDRKTGLAVGKENVVLTYKGIRLTADEIQANINTKVIAARGNVRFNSPRLKWKGKSLSGNLDKED